MSAPDSPSPSPEFEENLELTLMEVKQAQIDHMRAEANLLEAQILRVPKSLRDLTRAQGRLVGIWF